MAAILGISIISATEMNSGVIKIPRKSKNTSRLHHSRPLFERIQLPLGAKSVKDTIKTLGERCSDNVDILLRERRSEVFDKIPDINLSKSGLWKWRYHEFEELGKILEKCSQLKGLNLTFNLLDESLEKDYWPALCFALAKPPNLALIYIDNITDPRKQKMLTDIGFLPTMTSGLWVNSKKLFAI